MNWSVSATSCPGAPLPSQGSIAWTVVQPAGMVSEYPYVLDVNADGLDDGVGATGGATLAAPSVAAGVLTAVGAGAAGEGAVAAGVDAPPQAATTSPTARSRAGRTIRRPASC